MRILMYEEDHISFLLRKSRTTNTKKKINVSLIPDFSKMEKFDFERSDMTEIVIKSMGYLQTV